MPRTFPLQEALLLGDSNNAPGDVVLAVAFFRVEGRKAIAFVRLLLTPVSKRHAGSGELGHKLACHDKEFLRCLGAATTGGWRDVEDRLFRSNALADLVEETFREGGCAGRVFRPHQVSDELLAGNGNRIAFFVFLRAGRDLDGEFAAQGGSECFVEVRIELRVALLCGEILAPLAGVAGHAVVVFGGVEWHFDGDFEAEGGVDIDPVV